MRESRLVTVLWVAAMLFPPPGARALGAVVTLRPGQPGGGSTSLALQAGRVRLDLSASVRRRP